MALLHLAHDARPEALATAMGLLQLSDSTLIGNWCDDVIKAHPEKVSAFRNGRTGLLGLSRTNFPCPNRIHFKLIYFIPRFPC